jgi:Family of unknown function (DUF5906)/Primase C terminal 2 (PriCT-2)
VNAPLPAEQQTPLLNGIRLSMLHHGYRPVPVLRHDANDEAAGKRPTLAKWEAVCATADETEIRRWASDRRQRDCTNTGILCGHLIGLDLDVSDDAVAVQVGALADAMLPATPLLRIGKAPKSLRVFRAEGVHRKISTPPLLLPNGAKVQVEALGEGNHFVAFGIHPDTRQPYYWPGQSPLDVMFDDLPVLAAAVLGAFLAAAEAVMRAAGGKTEAEIKDGIQSPPQPTKKKPRPGNSIAFPPTTRQDVQDALRFVPNRHDWAGWVRIGGAIFDALADDGEDLFLEWSAQSSKDDAKASKAKWKSFRRSPMTISENTLFYEARKAGWKSAREIEREQRQHQSDMRPVYDEADDYGAPPPEIDDPGYEVLPPEALASDPVRALVAEFNARFMVVSEGGKILLYEPDTDPILNRRFYQRLDFSDFHKMWLNRTVRTGVDKKGEPVFNQVAPLWLRHPDRRQFIRGVIFDPSGSNRDPEKLNLWQGFAVQSRPGSWAKMKDHILNVICDGNSDLNDYVLNWAARMVQFPAEQGEVAIVLKGVEGSGKGTLANALRRIMGQHALKISNAKHLVGNFNSHLRDCVFLFADEAFFAGDKQHVGVLKSIITEDSLTIEAKYANAVETPNYLHLMMASNEEWVVPAGLEARRFLVLLTTAAKVRNFAYFKAIHAEMENGGYEAMLHELLNRNLTEFNVRDVPDTEGLQQQKKLSLGTSESWWLDVLHRGYVYKSKHGLEHHFGQWHETVTTEVLFAAYSEYARAKNERHPMAREAFGAFMKRVGAQPRRHRNGIVGEHITDVPSGPYGDTRRAGQVIKQPMATGYHLGTLEDARNAFQDDTKLTIEWTLNDDSVPEVD